MSFATLLLVATGGAFVFEGMLWAIFPSGVRRSYQEVFSLFDDKALHLSGLASVAIGVAFIILGVRLFA